MNNGEFQEHTQRIEELVQRVTALQDEDARTTALELLQSMMELHGAAVTRIVELLAVSEAGRSLLEKLGADPLVCGLLVLYGAHPVDLQTRVARAIENLRPRLHKQGGSAELININEGVVRVKVHSSGHGCGSSADALKNSVEQAILEAAPEVVEIIAEGAAPATASGFVPLSSIQPLSKQEKRYEESAA